MGWINEIKNAKKSRNTDKNWGSGLNDIVNHDERTPCHLKTPCHFINVTIMNANFFILSKVSPTKEINIKTSKKVQGKLLAFNTKVVNHL